MSVVPPYNAEIRLKVAGEVSVSERGETPGEKYYSSTTLVECDVDDGITAGLLYNTNEQFAEHLGIALEISALHIENSETGRVFHARNTAYLSWVQLEQLRDFCNFLLLLPREAA